MRFAAQLLALTASAYADHATCGDLRAAFQSSACCGTNDLDPTNYTVTSGSCYEECETDHLPFTTQDVATKNKVFDQLTVAEQLSIENMMKGYGVSFDDWAKCVSNTCSHIGKLALVKPPKAEVLAYFAGGPKPPRVASFWWLRADQTPRVAEMHTVTLPITASSTPTLQLSVPWNQRPFIYTEDEFVAAKRAPLLEPLLPIFDTMLAEITPSPSMQAKLDERGVNFSVSISFGGIELSVASSTPDVRNYGGSSAISCNVGPNYFKEGPMQFMSTYDWDTDEARVFDIVFCPGKGNPVFNSPSELLAAHNAGTLKYCSIDGEWYGDTVAHMDPAPPYYIPDEQTKRVGPVVDLPEGPRFSVHGRTVSWMGWDFHVDIHGLQGMHVSNLRFKGERIAYEIYATEFSAVYSGASTRKGIYYSDSGYEMGNCAITLREGLQCPKGSVFLKNLAYDNAYVWGAALTPDHESETQCIFEAPENDVLFQHAQSHYEGLPATALYVRNVLTVGNYDYIQTFKVHMDGKFQLGKHLSGYAVGGYILPDDPSSIRMAAFFGSRVSKSAYSVLHTHSAHTRIDLDIAGLHNSFKVMRPGLGNLADLLTETGIDTTGITYPSDTSYYFRSEYLISEGHWDNDGDSTWTPPSACIDVTAGEMYIAESSATTDLGSKRGYYLNVPKEPKQLLPEHNKFLHLQNFSKCNLAVTKHSEADAYAMPPTVFGALYPLPAPTGHDFSHFFNNESIADVDLVFYVAQMKYHFPKTEDVPVPSTMGGFITFEPFNYFTDDVSAFKHLPKTMYRYDQPGRDGIPVKACA